jgi:hypothetical protein
MGTWGAWAPAAAAILACGAIAGPAACSADPEPTWIVLAPAGTRTTASGSWRA